MAEAIAATKTTKIKKQSEFVRVFKELAKNKTAMLGLIILIIEVILAILAPVIAPYDYTAMDIVAAQQGPTMAHWFGTDELGRDIFSRCPPCCCPSCCLRCLAPDISTRSWRCPSTVCPLPPVCCVLR